MRVLVVGVGYWGPNIVRNLVEFSEIREIGIFDLDRRRAENIVRKYPRTHVAAPGIDDTYQAVFIVTPLASHAALAREALHRGLHVFVEKPIAQSVAETRELIELAQVHKRCLMVGHVFHYKPAVRKLAELVSSGELGTVYYVDSVRTNLGIFRTDTNVLWDLAPHDLSIFETVLQKLPKRVMAIGTCHARYSTNPQVTMGYLTFDYGDGCLGHLHVNWLSPLKQRRMVIAGSRKMAVYDDLSVDEPIRVYDCGMVPDDVGAFPFPNVRSGEVFAPLIKMTEPLFLQLKEFFSAIAEQRQPATDGWAGLRTVQILEAAHLSMEQGSFVEIGYGSSLR